MPETQVKSHEFVKLANRVVEALPPKDIPRVRTQTPPPDVAGEQKNLFRHALLRTDGTPPRTNPSRRLCVTSTGKLVERWLPILRRLHVERT